MSTPSLLNIPYLYKAGTLYSQIPESGAGDFTVSRTTTVANRSTRINKDGFIETVLDNVPRLDYPLGGAVNGCPALLVEPSAQNLVLRSQELDVSPTWSPVIGGTGLNPAITTNAVISPDGTQNAERIVFNRGAGNASADQSTLQQSITIPTTGAYILSVYAKASTAGDVGKQIFIRLGSAGGLIPVTLTANWVRYSQAESSVASGSQAVQIGNRGGFTANNSVSVDLWGAQVEAGSVPTSYIPTTTAAVTRSAEIISDTTASALIGQSEGTIYAEVDVRNLGLSRSFMNVQDTSYATNAVRIESQGNNWRIHIRAASVTILDQTIGSPVFATGIYKVALAYSTTANGVAFAVNGTIIYTNASALTMPSGMDRVFIGTRSTASPAFDLFLNDRIRAVELHPNRLSNAQLAALTAL